MKSTLRLVEPLAASGCHGAASVSSAQRKVGDSWGYSPKRVAFHKQGRSYTCIKCEQNAGDSSRVVYNNQAHLEREALQEKVVVSSLQGATPEDSICVDTKSSSRREDVLVEELSQRPESVDSNTNDGAGSNGNGYKALDESPLEAEAWRLLKKAVVSYCGQPVGTIAANDPTDPYPLNYDQVFIRDFIPSAIAFLLKGEHEIVRNFIHHTLQLQVLHRILFFIFIAFLE